MQAWANAVRADASVIVFDCGNYLRIGIRQREKQTLILSDLLDVCCAKNPAYGKIWAGTHIAIAQDVMERYQNRLASRPVPVPPTGLKRVSPEIEEGSNKKQKAKTRSTPGGKVCSIKILPNEILTNW